MPEPMTHLYVHLVWATWRDLPILVGERQRKVHAAIERECAAMGVDVLAIGGAPDHVHLLVDLPPTAAVSKLVEQAKAASSRVTEMTGIAAARFPWREDYGAFSISRQDVLYVRNYIRNQELYHRNHSTDPDLELP